MTLKSSMPRGAFWLALVLSLAYVALMALMMWLFEKAILATSVDSALKDAREWLHWTLIGATAATIFAVAYRLLARIESASDAGHAAAGATPAAPAAWPLLLVIGTLFVATGAYVYSAQEKNLDRALHYQLASVATQKAQVASGWVEERRRDLRVLLENKSFARDVEALLDAAPGSAWRIEPVAADLRALMTANRFLAVALLDTGARPIVTLPEKSTPHPDCVRLARNGPDAASSPRTALTPAFADAADRPTLDLAANLTAGAASAGRHLATLCVHVDLAQVLLPAVSSWPMRSYPGEIVLARLEGEDAVLLNAGGKRGGPWTLERRRGEAAHWREALEATRQGQFSERASPDAAVLVRAAYEVPGTPWIVLARMDQESASQLQSRLERHVTIVIGLLILFLAAAGTVVWARSRALNVSHTHERDALLARLSDMALHDELTGLPRRHVVEDRLRVALAQAVRERTGVGLLYVDFNRFKAINDAHGHAAGDAVLAAAATRMSQALRASDTVGRVGGDEFMCVLPFDSETVELDTVREKLEQRIREPIEWQGVTLRIGASIGWAIFPADGRTASELIACADRRMYVEKNATKSPAPNL